MRMPRPAQLAALLLVAAVLLPAQRVRLVPAPVLHLPTHIDGNSPAFWDQRELKLFTSTGAPQMISEAAGLRGRWTSQDVDTSGHLNQPMWTESAWRDKDGTVFGWYHHEPGGVCGANSGLTAPKIGAVISYDGGVSLRDLGIILESKWTPDCNAKNGFFAGGHGDFSVVLDREGKYFYFFFTNYSGPLEEQGIVVARLAFADRFHPAGAVHKYYQGEWSEPGIGGRTTPIFPARTAWQRGDADSYWGPAVHWNTYLRQYVMLLNRSCCSSGWPQEGIYIAFGAGPSDLLQWKGPGLLLEGGELPDRPGYYPQVFGLRPGETDSILGAFGRLFVHGVSRWRIEFAHRDGDNAEPEIERAPDLALPDVPDEQD